MHCPPSARFGRYRAEGRICARAVSANLFGSREPASRQPSPKRQSTVRKARTPTMDADQAVIRAEFLEESETQSLRRLAKPRPCQTRVGVGDYTRSEEHTSELQSQSNLVCRLLLE